MHIVNYQDMEGHDQSCILKLKGVRMWRFM